MSHSFKTIHDHKVLVLKLHMVKVQANACRVFFVFPTKHAICLINPSRLSKNKELFLEPILSPLGRNVVSSELVSKDRDKTLIQALVVKDRELEKESKEKEKRNPLILS